MTANVGSRLWASIWRSSEFQVSQVLSRSFRANVDSTILSRIPTRPFSAKNLPFCSKKCSRHVVTRSFASGGFFVLSAESKATGIESAPSCTATVEKALTNGAIKLSDRSRILNQTPWVSRSTSSFRKSWRVPRGGRRYKNTSSFDKSAKGSQKMESGKASQETIRKPEQSDLHDPSHVPNRHHFYGRIPPMPHLHRPSKEELLAAATGFWSRLKVRFKWFSIRSVRPFTMDEIGAFFSWIVLGHMIWIILGTTTFFSLAIFAINTVFAQETLAGWVGNYLTKSSGVKVVFESAIVPKWRDGVITFKRVYVSRRPGQGKSKVTKGSPEIVAAAAAAVSVNENPKNATHATEAGAEEEEEDTNFTQFDLSIDTVNVTLSFAKWFNGKGLLRDVEVKGIRGVVDRTSVHWSGEYVDPLSYRRERNPGDFEIDSFKMEDLLVTVYQPNNFRPFTVSIFSCDLPQLRKQWLFYDFLSANSMSGQFDNSLFAIHPRQTHSYTGAQLNAGVEETGDDNPWKKHSRIRIDGLNIDHLNRGIEGPFSWIYEGNVDIVADVMLPADADESIAKVMSDFYDRLEATVTSNRIHAVQPPAHGEDIEAGEKGSDGVVVRSSHNKRFLIMDLRIHLNDVRAAVPLFTRDLSYVNNALIRPIVAYINTRRTFIPINCRLVKRTSDFDGSWTVFDSGLMDDLSAEAYEAFAQNVVDDQARKRRFKKVGLWSLQLAAQAIFLGMAGNVV